MRFIIIILTTLLFGFSLHADEMEGRVFRSSKKENVGNEELLVNAQVVFNFDGSVVNSVNPAGKPNETDKYHYKIDKHYIYLTPDRNSYMKLVKRDGAWLLDVYINGMYKRSMVEVIPDR